MGRRIVVGISGASGAAYSRRVVQLLVEAGVEVHLVVSPLGQRMLHDELGMEGVDLAGLAGRSDHGITFHHYRDVGAPIASGSFSHGGMIVVPCSNNSLASIAHGSSDNLLHRAANVALKERRPLVIAHRETPLGLIEIRNMEQIALAGGVLAPTNPGFYMLPESIEDLVDFMAGRLLDLVGVEHRLNTRWTESRANFRSRSR